MTSGFQLIVKIRVVEPIFVEVLDRGLSNFPLGRHRVGSAVLLLGYPAAALP